MYDICMYGTYSSTVINQLVHCIKWTSWSIPQLPVAQVNNKTVQIVCIESNARCIKESNYTDLLNQECRLKPWTNSGASFRKPKFCLGSANLWLCEKVFRISNWTRSPSFGFSLKDIPTIWIIFFPTPDPISSTVFISTFPAKNTFHFRWKFYKYILLI